MSTTLDFEKAIKALSREFKGELLRPTDANYAASRALFNMRRDKDVPALIARATDADDVSCVMRYATAHGQPVAIRSGGHGVDGSAMPDGGLVLDLTQLKRVVVDPNHQTVQVGAGVLLGELDAATQAHGLVVPSGTVSSTGVAGLCLGGGVGYLIRRFGATVDNLLWCKVVTTDGRQLIASRDENTDLFWALRGGGGNFAVVTEFEFKAHKLGPEVTAGFIVYSFEQATSVLVALRDHMTTAPRELAVIASMAPCPPLPPVPQAAWGVPVLMLIVVHTGPDASSCVAKLASLGQPVANVVGPAPWVQVNRMLDVIAPYGRRVHTRGGYMSDLTGDVIQIATSAASAPPAPTSQAPSSVQNIWFLGGAISEDFAEESVAFSRVGAKVFWECVGQWDGAEHDARYVSWVDGVADALGPHMRANGYVNLTTDRGAAWLAGLYGSPEKYQRLIAAKTKWDPHNLLRFNKNFKPGTPTDRVEVRP